MKQYRIKEEMIARFTAHLHTEERSVETRAKYLHEVGTFWTWLGDQAVTKDKVAEWKERLKQAGKAAVTINGALAALHSFFAMLGWDECRVKYLKVQRKMFRDTSRDLNRDEYFRLVAAANRNGNERLAMLLETICGTGVRVSEVRYLTVEALRHGRAEVDLKGKIRTILIPGKLAKKLLKYCQKQKITSGEVFITARGTSMSRRQIWGEMKRLCKAAGVEASKVFPHNLRHLFARAYYKACKDIVQLADVLGHSSIETTRIYLITTGAEHARRMDQLGLIS